MLPLKQNVEALIAAFTDQSRVTVDCSGRVDYWCRLILSFVDALSQQEDRLDNNTE